MHQMMIQGPPGTEPQVVQVLSLKDAAAFSKVIAEGGIIKNEGGTTIIEH